MKELAIYLVTLVLFSLFGALDIAEAVRDFKKQRYFLFGMDVFGALIMAFVILEAVLES